MEKLIITCALTGAEVTKQQNPNVPITPEEIAQAALAARQAGAAVVHVHGRRPDGTATQDREVYAEIIRKIRESGNDVIVQVSTGGAVGMTVEERIQPVTLKPEMSSLNSGSVNFGDSVFMNAPLDIERFAQAIKDHGVMPELEIYDVGMITNAIVLMEKGLVPKHAPFNLVMGVPGAIPGTPRNLLFLVESLPKGSPWTVSGIGRAQLPLATIAIVLGGNVRVGLEDNIYYRKGELASSNSQLVERIVRISSELGREIASPTEARQLLGIGVL